MEARRPEGAPGLPFVAALHEVAMASTVRMRGVIDGRTGRPIENGSAGVVVMAETALMADALATALAVMGPEAGLAFAREAELAAAWTVRGAFALTEVVSPAFQAMLETGA
jgi:thiamine biosynthesis lipoprotein